MVKLSSVLVALVGPWGWSKQVDTKVPGVQRMEVMGDESPRSHGSSNVDPKKNDHKIHGIKPLQ